MSIDLEDRRGLFDRNADDDDFGDQPNPHDPHDDANNTCLGRFVSRHARWMAIGFAVTLLLLVTLIGLSAAGIINSPGDPDGGHGRAGADEQHFPRATYPRAKGQRPALSPAARELLRSRNSFVAVVAAVLATKGPVLECPSADDTELVISDVLETLTTVERRALVTAATAAELNIIRLHRDDLVRDAAPAANGSTPTPTPSPTAVPLNPLRAFRAVADADNPMADVPVQAWGVLVADFTTRTAEHAARARERDARAAAFLKNAGRAGALLSGAAAAINPKQPPVALLDWPRLVSGAVPVDIVVALGLSAALTDQINAFRFRASVQWFDAAPAYLLSNTLDVNALLTTGNGPVLLQSRGAESRPGSVSFPGAEANAHVLPLVTAALATTGSILEMGTSEYGTPLLNLISRVGDRYVLTADSDFDAVGRFEGAWTAPNHEYTTVGDGLLGPPPDKPVAAPGAAAPTAPVAAAPASATPAATKATATGDATPTAATAVASAPASASVTATASPTVPLSWSQVGVLEKWSVAYIASDPMYERVTHAKGLATATEIVVVANADHPDVGLAGGLAVTDDDFKYQFLYDTFGTQTAVLSRHINVATLFEELSVAARNGNNNSTSPATAGTGTSTATSSAATTTSTAHCASQPCQHGMCIEYVHTYGCVCDAGWVGKACEVEADPCRQISEPCSGHGTCEALSGTEFRCACDAGYDGEFCDFDIDDCLSAPCQNGAQCLDERLKYSCVCAAGFMGRDCEIAVPRTSRNALVALVAGLTRALSVPAVDPTPQPGASTPTDGSSSSPDGATGAGAKQRPAYAGEETGPILEIGSERFSTELIHVMCQARLNGRCTSLDNSARLDALPLSLTRRPEHLSASDFTPQILQSVASRDQLMKGLKSAARWALIFVDYSSANIKFADVAGVTVKTASGAPARAVLDLPLLIAAADIVVVSAMPPEYASYVKSVQYSTSVNWFSATVAGVAGGGGDYGDADSAAAWVLSNTTDVTTLFAVSVGQPPAQVEAQDQKTESDETVSAEHGSELIPLATALLSTTGAVLQLGANLYSAGVAHVLAQYDTGRGGKSFGANPNGNVATGADAVPAPFRYVLTASSDERWVQDQRWLAVKGVHDFVAVPVYTHSHGGAAAGPGPGVVENATVWDHVGRGAGTKWSVVSMDHQPATRRKVDIDAFCCDGSAELVLWHDSSNRLYGYDDAAKRYKYTVHYAGFLSSSTAVASNTVDVEKLFAPKAV